MADVDTHTEEDEWLKRVLAAEPHERTGLLNSELWEVISMLGQIVDETEQDDRIDGYERRALQMGEAVERHLATLAAALSGRAAADTHTEALREHLPIIAKAIATEWSAGMGGNGKFRQAHASLVVLCDHAGIRIDCGCGIFGHRHNCPRDALAAAGGEAVPECVCAPDEYCAADDCRGAAAGGEEADRG